MSKRATAIVSVIKTPRGRSAKVPAIAAAPVPAKAVKPVKAVTKRGLTPNQKRAKQAWKTRRANLLAKGLLDEHGNPTRKEVRRRRTQALKAWATRRLRQAA